MIETNALTKSYGPKLAVDHVNFTAKPGEVTGILGPNGAGKSTTMRLIMGLDAPTSGSATISGKPLRDHDAPLHIAGALLDAKGVHPGRTATSHLQALAATHGIGNKRVTEVLELTGLSEVAKKRVGGFSLGMGQRLGIAAALLGDPQTLILDEPVNGLDPDGVMWVRSLLRHLASEGRTVVLSSHLMSEMAQVADHVVVFGKGRIVANASIDEFLNNGTTRTSIVTPQAEELARLLSSPEVTVQSAAAGALTVTGLDAPAIGEIAAKHGLVLHELTPLKTSLEDAYIELTRDHVEYQTGAAS
ncbi:ATP-binding cassette domain-containing protein [Leucobacter chinensis]|uniref:ATP-binding cassette domain-containing protein n=1 Tax=Leucobacter chinensis TaxID=2851010 RepID=UPI001C214A00|nr:ATP-binding cassette domain-containing protein [Leucobacter chinensis]